jgi:hypothetical protein
MIRVESRLIGYKVVFSAKAGRIDHIWLVGLQLIYITKQQALNSCLWRSIWSGQMWSRPLVFLVSSCFYFFVNQKNSIINVI